MLRYISILHFFRASISVLGILILGHRIRFHSYHTYLFQIKRHGTKTNAITQNLENRELNRLIYLRYFIIVIFFLNILYLND